MTLKEITQDICATQRLAEQDSKAALAQNRSLFVNLARQNEAYIIPEVEVPAAALEQKLFRPYAASAQTDDPRLFLRIFSHEGPALSFAEKSSSGQVAKVDGVELMQLAKFWFLRGIYGFLLNDGLAWAAISFPDFLAGMFEEVLDDSAMTNPEYVGLIQFINMLRQNEFYQIKLARQITEDTLHQLFFMDAVGQSLFDNSEFTLEPCSLQSLTQLAGLPVDTQIHIKTAKLDLAVNLNTFQTAIRIAETASLDKENLDFHLNSVSLDFSLEDLTAEPKACLQMVSVPSTEEAPKEEQEAALKWEPFTFAKQVGKQVEIWLSALIQQKQKRHAAMAGDVETAVKQTRHFSGLIGKGFVGAVVLVIVVFSVTTMLKPAPDKAVRSAIVSGDYTELPALYNACVRKDADTRETLLPLMAEDLQAHLDAYAADNCAAEELAAVIESYRQISAMDNTVTTAYTKAAALDQAKLAYQYELLKTSNLTRLEDWRAIISDDTGSVSAMRENLSKNAGVYKSSVFLEISDMPAKAAQAGLYLLQSYYPDDPEIPARIKELSNSAGDRPSNELTSGVSSLDSSEAQPVSIQDIYCQSTGSGGEVDLVILWTNKSGKTIDHISFMVVPLDADGSPLTTLVDGEDGLYSKYNASAAGPFEPGYQMTEDVVWKLAWVNPSIESLRIEAIYITYAGEQANSTVSITNMEEIAALFASNE